MRKIKHLKKFILILIVLKNYPSKFLQYEFDNISLHLIALKIMLKNSYKGKYLLIKIINIYTIQVYIRIVESAPAENTHGCIG